MNVYSDPILYDAIHKKYNWDLNLLTSIKKKIRSPVLELASGTGRLTNFFLNNGFDYTGMDNNLVFLEEARRKYKHQVDFVSGDVRNFNIKKKFNFIFMSYNSFQHILTNDDAKSCLKCVNSHLTESGLFLISMSIPRASLLYRGKNKLVVATEIFEYQNYKCQLMEENNYDEEKQINHIKWYLKRNNKIERESYNFDFRLFFPHQIDIFFSECNLVIKKKSSDIYGTPISEKSLVQIYECGK
tara:strand:+ start:34507 stop:35235 length:729 start_codon:yes stop_codon:yes gene_type:complete